MASMSIAGYSLLERWLDVPSSRLETLAQDYVEAAGRTRRRPMPLQMRYQFPRGRRTDVVPISPALTIGRG